MTPEAPKPETPGTPEATQPTATPEAWPKRTQAIRDQVTKASLKTIAGTLPTLADSAPEFGSVTQTTTGEISANARFNFDTTELAITAGNVYLHSYNAFTSDVAAASDQHNTDGKTYQIASGTNNYFTSSVIDLKLTSNTHTNRDFQNTYSARGYYLTLAGRYLLRTAPQIERLNAGVFIDGNRYGPEPPQLDSTRQHGFMARYEGNAGGFAAFTHGAGVTGRTSDTDPSNPIRTSSGSWGEQFSRVTEGVPYIYNTGGREYSGTARVPAAIGGTLGTTGTSQDGTTVTLTGAYEAFGTRHFGTNHADRCTSGSSAYCPGPLE